MDPPGVRYSKDYCYIPAIMNDVAITDGTDSNAPFAHEGGAARRRRGVSYHARSFISSLISPILSKDFTVSTILSAFARGMGRAENSTQP